MQLWIAFIFAKLLGDVCFVEVIINSNAYVHKNLRQNNQCKKYGNEFFQGIANVKEFRSIENLGTQPFIF